MLPQTDLFNPEHYQAVRRPLLEAETMPAWCYTSPEFYRREVERIWKKAWNFIGHVEQIPNPATISRSRSSVSPSSFATRRRRVRAFANSCRHRGSELLEGSGNCRSDILPISQLDLRPRRTAARRA